ncbi:MAG: T9SS type A sorting domain-containing protein [Bacteroidetes bacterium]|nr:T9SS type A sorting domain-containing protein [Bacteroidota bacterium]
MSLIRKTILLSLMILLCHSYSHAQCALDVFVANDQSGSVDIHEHGSSRHFIRTLMEGMQPLGTDPGESRMAVAEWAAAGSWLQYTYPSFGQNYTPLLSDVINYQLSPRVLTGGTDPWSALSRTYQMVNQTPIAGRTASKIIVLMTDAACSQVAPGISNLATQIKNEGIYIIVVAIGAGPPCPALAGTSVASPGGYFSAPNYASLEDANVNLVQNMINAGCTGPPSPTFDLSITLNSYTKSNCASGNPDYLLSYTVMNAAGAGENFNDSLTISFYNGDPQLPTTSLLFVQQLGTQAIPINGSYIGSTSNALLGNSASLYAVVNYDGNLMGNEPPIPPYIFNETYIVPEQITFNNFSNGITWVGDASCPPYAVLDVDVQNGGIGCNNLTNYEVTICNTGDANAFVSTSLPIPVPGAILQNDTTTPINYTVDLLWSTYYGGSDEDYGYKVATDASGNVFMAGTTRSSTNIASTGAHQTSKGSGSDAFLVKFDAEGNRLWGTYYGGSEQDFAYGVATDPSGNVFIVGNTESPNNIATAGAYQTSHANSDDGFIVKFNSAGVRQWGSYYGGAGTDFGIACATDASGNVYLAGYTEGSTTLASAGAHQATFGGNADEFLVKFNSSGTRQWATYYGGTEEDLEPDVATDPSGNVYLAGRCQSSTGIATSGAHQTINRGDDDVFLAKFNSSGVRQWGTFYGGTQSEVEPCVATDAFGNVFLAGETRSTSFIVTAGAHQTSISGSRDAFLIKFNSSGSRQWGSYFGGGGTESAKGIAADHNGNVFITGPTNSSSGISTPDSYQPGSMGADSYVAKFKPGGARDWGTYFGGTGPDEGRGLATDGFGSIFLSGFTASTSSIATTGAHQTIYGGDVDDAFLAKFSELETGSLILSNECVTRQYTYDLSGVMAGTYDFSFGLGADTVTIGDGEPIITPDTTFTIGSLTDLDGFNGTLHSSDNVTITASNPACAPGDQVFVSVDIPTSSTCGNEYIVQATVTINNTSGLDIFNTSLHLILTGTGSIYAGEIYNLTSGLDILVPSLLDPSYPSVPYALYGQSGSEFLPVQTIPAGTSTFNIDILTGSALTNLSVQIDSIPSPFNASGLTNLAIDAGGVSIYAYPTISGFNCVASINTGSNITFFGITTTNTASVLWSSSTMASLTNSGTLANPSLTYTPNATDNANGYAEISLQATSSNGCESIVFCQVAINNVLYDYGDAPLTYDLGQNSEPIAGSSTLLTGLHLGMNAPGTEAIANNSSAANGDGMEEDALLSAGCNATPVAGSPYTIEVEATNSSSLTGYISAFIDWNTNGEYLADSERVSVIQLAPALSALQQYTLSFDVPYDLNTNASQYFIRLRISTDSIAASRPFGAASQGETEDHLLQIGGSVLTNTTDTTICIGHSITIGANTYDQAGTHIDTLTGSTGCDSIQTTNLFIAPLNPLQGLYTATPTHYLRTDPYTGTFTDTINSNPLSLGWINNSTAIHERGRRTYWISEQLNLHSLNLETGVETSTTTEISTLPFFWGMKYYNGHLYILTISADNDKMLVRVDPSTGDLDTGFPGVEINGTAGYSLSLGSSAVIDASAGKYYIPVLNNAILEFDINGGNGNILNLTGLIPTPGIINLLEINEYTGQMYGFSGYSNLVSITVTSAVTANIGLVKALTMASGYSNPISTFDSENNMYIFQAQTGCGADNPLVTVDVNTGQEWCSDPPGIALMQMEFLNCAPVSQLKQIVPTPKVLLYPNPIKEDLHVQLTLPSDGKVHIKVTGISGNTVRQTTIEGLKGLNELPLDLSFLSTGMYVIELASGTFRYSEKVVKQ